MAIKTVISYVSGTGGDFVVNCCNQVWNTIADQGHVIPSSSIKRQELVLGDQDLVDHINSLPQPYVGSHSIDRLLRMPVNVVWLTVPDQSAFKLWVARDAVLRHHSRLLGRHGNVYETVSKLIAHGQQLQAAKLYLKWLEQYNWTLMQMRLVQPTNQIDISRLLEPNGIDSVCSQIPDMMSNFDQCRYYHDLWLQQQLPYQDQHWVLNCVGTKLEKLVLDH